MKTLHNSLNSNRVPRRLIRHLATAATLALVAFGAVSWPASSYADARHREREDADIADLRALVNKAQVHELLDLAADFHAALSYNGDPATKSSHLAAMSSLWASASSLTFSNTLTTVTSSYSGKDAVLGFFAAGGYFLNHWVSLAPEYKTQVTVHGDRAHISTQCVGIDLTASPMVVKNVIQVEADVVRKGDKWLFTAMHNSSPAPL